MTEVYPSIKKRAKVENAEIHWVDETGCKNQCNHGKSYAPKGKTPVKRSKAQTFKVNMVSSVTNQGKVHFMLYSENMNAQKMIGFMTQLTKSGRGKKFLILDNLKVHHSKILKAWLEQEDIKQKLEVFYLPSYSPELNPDEYLNGDLKCELSYLPAPRDVNMLEKNVTEKMNMIKKNKKRVKKYFKHGDIKYAA